MNVSEHTGLESFQNFVAKQLASGAAVALSPDEALALWREEQEVLAAISEGMSDVAEGRTKSLHEFDSDFRNRHGLKGSA